MVAPDPSVPGLHRSPWVQLYAALLVLLSVAAAFLVGSSLRTARDFRWVWWILIAIGVLQVWPPLTMDPGLTRPPWNVLLESHAAAFVLAALLFAPPNRRWILCLEIAVILVAVAEIALFQVFGMRKGQWVSGWLALAGSFATILALWSPRALLLVALIAVLVLFLARGFVQQRLSEAETKSDFQRFAMWRDALRLAARRPWLGVGPGNYPDYMVRYAHSPLEAGPAAHAVHPGIGSAHGNYLQVAADLGLTGLWALGWVFTRTFRSGRAVLDRVEDPFLAAITAGSLGAIGGQLTASVLGDYLLPSYHNGGHVNFSTTVYTWILVGTIMALETQVFSASPGSENSLRA